jgi:(S)-beta-tyrosine adenylation enzyme
LDRTSGGDVTAFVSPRIGVGQVVTSWAQDGFWFLDRMLPRTTAYRICRGYEVCGPVNIAALRAAWRVVVGRHDVLRTTFTEADGHLVQRVAATSTPAVSFVDMGHVGPGERQASADRYCVKVAGGPLELADGPLAQLTVVKLSATDHRIVLVLHRAVADERSASLLVDELSAAYARALDPSLPEPPEPVAQYADYARWQRGQETTPGASQRLLDWWTGALRPLPPPPVLPVDRDRGMSPAVPGEVRRFDWGTDLAGALEALCGKENVTPFAVVLAAFQVLLHRYSGEERIAVGTTVPVRPPQFADLIGPCENLLVLAGGMDGSVTFREAVAWAAGTAADAVEHRGLPFLHLVRALNPPREPGRIPLCDAIVVVPEEPEAQLHLAGAQVRPYPLDAGTAPTRLALTVDEIGPSLRGRLAYRREEFDRETAAAVLDQLRTLLAAGLAAPDTPVGELPLDSPVRARELARAADGITGAATATEPVHETVRRQPNDAVAVASGTGAVSYAELNRDADRIAGILSGVKGSAVVIRMTPGARQLAASLGVLRAGGHIVWFGTGDSGERGRTVLTELRPACLVVQGDPATDELARWYRDELGGRVLDVDRDVPETVPRRESVALDAVAYVAYTSGSTGRPKGIAQTHGAFAQFVAWMAGEFGLGPGSRVAQWAAPEHDPALAEVFATVVSGATLCPVPDRIRAHPEKLVGWLAAERITFLQTVPSFAREILKVVKGSGAADRLVALERIVLMGEALPGELANGLRTVLPHVRLANIYGPTETIAATWYEITDDIDGTVPIGRSIPGRQVLILDDTDRPCPTGFTGEIVIRSPYVAAGYVGDPAGGGAFRSVPGFEDGTDGLRWYHTGDLARRRWDGLVEFRGRRDLQVKLYGTRVELAEVEAALAEHDSVAECVVVPLTDRDGLVVRLVAYVVPRCTDPDGTTAGADAWRAHLRQRFGASVTLVSFETLTNRLPRNVGGKVDRRRLPAPRAVLAQAARRPRTWVEGAMAEIWSQLLGIGHVDADESFFAVGGHSLLVPQLVGRIRQRFGVDIPIWECLAHSTLAGMSALVAAAGPQGTAAQPDPTHAQLLPRR